MLAAMLVWSGCELITAIDHDRIDEGGSGGSGQGGAAQGGDGGATACDASQCPGNDTACAVRACDSDGLCDVDNISTGTSCTDATNADATLCDGMGSCVECNDMADCSGGELCQANECVLAACVNGMLDAGETDVDCGGVCTPCDNGMDCTVAGDCMSDFCDAGTCAVCTLDTDCAAGQYCNAGACTAQLINGDVCAGSSECADGNCAADGVCCDTPCAQACQACTAVKTGGVNGTCSSIIAGTDPDDECATNLLACQTGVCDGDANTPACASAANGSVCRPGSGDQCDPDEVCAGGVCPGDQFDNGSTVCRAGSGDQCDPSEQCPGSAGLGCPTDVVLAMGAECRTAADDCDAAENCTGMVGATCPADVVAAQGNVGSPTSCSPYVCDGDNVACPSTCIGTMDCAATFTCNIGPNKCQ
jgi:hypothetical protein